MWQQANSQDWVRDTGVERLPDEPAFKYVNRASRVCPDYIFSWKTEVIGNYLNSVEIPSNCALSNVTVDGVPHMTIRINFIDVEFDTTNQSIPLHLMSLQNVTVRGSTKHCSTISYVRHYSRNMILNDERWTVTDTSGRVWKPMGGCLTLENEDERKSFEDDVKAFMRS